MHTYSDIPANQQGFTLIELLLSIGIIVVIAGLSLPFYQSFQTRNDLAATSGSIAEMLRRAETYARGNNGDSQWGVNLQSGAATLFKGTSYGSRATGFDEVLAIPAPITLSYSGDVVFAKLTGYPASPASETLTANGSSRIITVNSKGMIDD